MEIQQLAKEKNNLSEHYEELGALYE